MTKRLDHTKYEILHYVAPMLKSSLQQILRSSSQSGLPLLNLHISNDNTMEKNGSFIFYVDVFFPLSLSILLPDLTILSNTAGVL